MSMMTTGLAGVIIIAVIEMMARMMTATNITD